MTTSNPIEDTPSEVASRLGFICGIHSALWAPVTSGGLILFTGAVALLVGQPLLFPGLGPSAYLQAECPESVYSSWYNILVGHLVGLFAGCLVVVVLGIDQTPAFLASQDLPIMRVVAAAIAVALTVFVAGRLRAVHPPAASTAVLVALGGIHANSSAIVASVIGIVVVAFFGEGIRRLRINTKTT